MCKLKKEGGGVTLPYPPWGWEVYQVCWRRISSLVEEGKVGHIMAELAVGKNIVLGIGEGDGNFGEENQD